MGEHIEIRNLPIAVQHALKAVDYNRKDIEVIASETVVLSGSGSSGSRAFVTLVNLTTGVWRTEVGSWGGANMFTTNAVDSDDTSYPLPADGVAIRGSRGGGQPVWARLHIPASMVDRMLPTRGEQVSKVELDALYCHHAITGGQYRRDELARRAVPAETVDALVSRGLLARNRAGATSITTAGKNAVGDYRGH